MPDELTVDLVDSAGSMPAVCPLCSSAFTIALPAALLYDANRPLGYLCERCFLAGPQEAAAKVRERAAELRASVNRTGAQFPVAAWGGMMASLRRRAEHWEEMAGRLEWLDTWPPRA